MTTRIAAHVVRYPWLYILLFVGTAAAFGSQIPRAEIEPEVKEMLPKDFPARVNLDRIEELFGGSEMILVAFSAPEGDDILSPETLKRVKAVSKAMERDKRFEKVVSLFTAKEIKGEDGTMIVDPAVRRLPTTTKRREALRESLRDNDMVWGSILSKDYKHTAIIGMFSFSAGDEAMVEKVKEIVATHPGAEHVEIAGMPVARIHVSRDIPGDMRKFLPFGLLLMFIFLLVAFRQARGVLLPFFVTIMAIVVAMGLIPVLGWKIHMVSVILPVVLLAVANDYGIHVFARYQEVNTPGTTLDSRALAQDGIEHLSKPVMATAVTTAAGLLCLLSHLIVPAKQMGILASAGVIFALAASLLFIPAVLAVLPRAKPVLGREGKRRALLDRMLHRTARWVSLHPRGVIVGIVIVVAVVATGIRLVVVDTNPVNYYPPGAPVPKAMNVANDNFGGALGLSVVAAGGEDDFVKRPEVMRAIDELQTHMEEHPNIDITSSIATVMKQMNEVMHDGDEAYDKVPDTKELIAQYFLLYSASGDPDDFDRLVDFPYRHAQVMLRVNSSSTNVAKDVVGEVKSYLEARPDSPFSMVGGFADLFSELVDEVVWGQVISLLLSLVLVGILVGLLFRSFVGAILAVAPIGLSILLLFGVMGYTGVELNVATAMMSSIMIGVGVDYTIHFLWRYRHERSHGREPAEAVYETLTTSGRGIVFNALSVIVGFVVLMISAFLPVRFFGALVVLSIGTCLIGALVLLPAIALVFKPRFLEGAPPGAEGATAGSAIAAERNE